ncbi:MAG TPA: long-chain-acyl-CoA synthetase [Steroidobacteraceae bacterium]|jgi:fatty-acyl-CoA synthase|nr:long-chain-acyl-CoA synthetase [Steroidobacteraceae bacterium]
MAARGGENKRSPLKAWVRALERTAAIERDRTLTLPALIGRLGERFGDAPALVSADAALSYRGLAAACNRYARWGLSRGLAPGEVVCLLMANCPDYMAIWLGLSGIGVTVALINTNLSGELLAHSLRLVGPRYVIAGATLSAAVAEVRAQLGADVECWVHGAGGAELPRLDVAIAAFPGEALAPHEARAPLLEDRALCIYTSGTTGLPKAANVSHSRIMQWSHWFAGLIDVQPRDRMYNCLPMYHSVGGVVATGATLVGGGAVVLRERFSASGFWQDVVTERCTLFQYIGELCRYLLNSPPQAAETRHTLRLACGNGLRGDVWSEFQARFRIPEILEYYAATEGNFSLYNCEGRVGAIGRIPPFLAHRVPVAVVQFDLGAAAPARDAGGRCRRCPPGEVGEAIGQILDTSAATRFEGYTDPAASGKKILRDVFAPGDAWYRTGDLMRQDEQGFFYFVDRVGDTFRWKGENVSTTEVEAVIGGCAQVSDVAVYGVTVPGTEGRAGMAALVVAPDFDPGELRRALAARLPEYARPVFLRIVPAIELTGTFKLRKQELALEGYDPARIRDVLYLDQAAPGAYVRLDAALHRRLVAGELRL